MQKILKEINHFCVCNPFNFDTKICSLKFRDKKLFDRGWWKSYKQFDDMKYKKTILKRTEIYELVLICWKPHQISPIHSHPERGCLLKVLEGQLKEKKLNSSCIITTLFNEGDISYISGKKGIHNLGNYSKENAVSLHLYSPPGYYDE